MAMWKSFQSGARGLQTALRAQGGSHPDFQTFRSTFLAGTRCVAGAVPGDLPPSRSRLGSDMSATKTLAAGVKSAQSSTPRRPPKALVKPLPPFVDHRFPGPEPHVAAFFLPKGINLTQLKQKLTEMGCPTVMLQNQILFSGSSEQVGQQRCHAIFMPDGSAVCWHMSRQTELLILKVAASCSGPRRGPSRWTKLGGPLPSERMDELGLSTPLAEERLEVMDAPPSVVTDVNAQDGSVRLTRDPFMRPQHELGISLGLAAAARLDALEHQIETKLEENWRDIPREAKRTINLSSVSHRIFVMETSLHDLRYELNSEAGCVDAPDILWDHAMPERLYEAVLIHHDTRRRTAALNERVSYSLDYLNSLNEHVRHQYSVRLEVIIIVLIFFELCVGVFGVCTGAEGGHGGAQLAKAAIDMVKATPPSSSSSSSPPSDIGSCSHLSSSQQMSVHANGLGSSSNSGPVSLRSPA